MPLSREVGYCMFLVFLRLKSLPIDKRLLSMVNEHLYQCICEQTKTRLHFSKSIMLALPPMVYPLNNLPLDTLIDPAIVRGNYSHAHTQS